MKRFLDSGKPLYIEGNDLYRDHQSTELYTYWGATYVGDGQEAWLGNIDSVLGVEGTFLGGLVYRFPQWADVDEKPDIITASGTGNLILTSQDGLGRAVSNIGNGYRVITSSIIFGAIFASEGNPEPDQLFAAYLDFLFGQDSEVEDPGYLPDGFTLYPNYPNPFNPDTEIRVSLEKNCPVVVKVYDVKGRLVEVLFDGLKSEGIHRFRFNAGNRPSGVYFAVVQTGARQRVQKMMLQK